MKKVKITMRVILMMTISLFTTLQAKSQLNYADSLQMQFDSLDVKYFPSGILHNTSPYYWNCFYWDSIGQSFNLNSYYLPNPYLYENGLIEMSHKTFNDIYFDLYLSSVRDSAIIHPNDYFTSDSIARLTSNVPITILRMNFHELNPSAVGTGKLWFDTLINQYTIMPDTIWPPDSLNYPDSIFYLVENPDSLAFLAFNNYWVNGANTTNPYIYVNWTNKDQSGNTQWDYSYSATFSIPQGLFLTNDTNNISSVNIDYGDGNGFIKQSIGTTKNITYHEIIPLNQIGDDPLNPIPIEFTKEIAIKMPPNGTEDSLTLKFEVKIIINEHPADTSFTTDNLPFLCDVIDSNYSATPALVSIRFVNSNYRHLTNPIIISGGFEGDLRDYGALRYEGLMTGYFYTAELQRTLLRLKEMPYLLDSLNAMGYDIIFIDQKDPRDYIQNAGLSVVKVIQWVNSELEKEESYNKPIVLGASMGGLIVRYALRMMELQGCCHNTRIYATFDSPHNGANISISSQYFVKDLRDFSETLIPKRKWLGLRDVVKDKVSPIISSYDLVLNSPAARQMLIYHRESSAYNDYSNFYSFLDSIGQPQNCRRLSIVNGSEKAIPNTIANADKMLLSMKMYSLAPATYFPNPSPLHNWLVFPIPRKLIDFTAYSESKPIIYEYNDAVLASHAYGTTWKKLYLYSSLGMTVTDLIGLYPPLTIPMQGVKVGIKSGAGIGFTYLNAEGTTIYNVTNSAYPVSYTEVPGSRSETFKEIADAAKVKVLWDSLALIKAGTPAHTFMPTATTLDMHESNLYLNIKQAYLADPYITPFDCYWAPQRIEGVSEPENMLHVEVDAQNRAWILEQIKNDWELRAASGEYKGVLTGYYNYGHPYLDSINIVYANKPHQTILYSLDIENNGQLFVNKPDVIGLSTGTLIPRQGSTFKLKTNCEPCDSTVVRIKYGGKFVIGEENNGIFNKGEVHFCKNSTLEILGNGYLIVRDSSRLIIEDGANLIIHPGAVVLLEGSASILELKGKVVIKDNATLEPLGDGFIRFAANYHSTQVQDYWDAGSNSALVLRSPNSNLIKKAEIIESVTFPDSLSIYFTNAKVELDSMKAIYSYGSIQAQNSVFTAIDTNKFYRSVSVFGQPNTRFGSCRFEFGNMGLYAAMGSGGNTITLDTCTFTKNYIGLYTMDQYISLNHCKANYNLDYGWVAAVMQSTCTAKNSEFNNNGYSGIKFDSQSNSTLNLRSSELNDNYQHGVEVEWGVLQANCSEFNRNGYAGIYAKDKSEINLAGVSKNSIRYNNTGILFNMAKSIRIENGYNNFSGNQYYLLGEMMPDNYYTPNTSPYGIDIDNNLMPSTLPNTLPISLYYFDQSYNGYTQLPMNGWTQNLNWWECVCINIVITPNYDNYKPFDGKITTSVISTPRFPNTYLIDALRLAAMQMSYGDDYVGNDTLAIAMFKEAFNNIPPTINEDEHWAIDYSLGLMITSLTNAIKQKLIDPNRALDGMPVDEYVGMIAQEIQNRLNDVDYANQYAEEQEAYFHLLMAQMYRAAEHYDYALNILQNDNYFFNTTLKNQADYWNCVCNAENQLLKGRIERSEYQMQIDSCHEMSNARLGMFMPILGETNVNESSKENQILGIYPNPAEQLIAIDFTLNVEEVYIELNDLSGRLIWQTSQIVNGKQLRLNLPKLASGTYMLKTITENQVFNNKIVIR